jgi:hypothetical protein
MVSYAPYFKFAFARGELIDHGLVLSSWKRIYSLIGDFTQGTYIRIDNKN